jgi:excisionase family DNA binding protein
MKNIAQQFDSVGRGEVYYTIAEVCAILKVSEPTLWRLSKFRGLRKVKDGGLVRYRKSVVDRWMADRESGADSN